MAENTLSVSEAAALTGVDASTIRRLCRSGDIPAERISSGWIMQRESLRKFHKRGRGRPSKQK